MRKVVGLSLAILLCLLTIGCLKSNTGVSEDQLKQTAAAFVTAVSQQNFAAASEHFTADLHTKMPPKGLAEIWKAVEENAGKFQKPLRVRVTQVTIAGKSYQTLLTTCRFEHGNVDISTEFDEQGKIRAIGIGPTGV